jgi:hypothetical protein
MEPVVEKSRQLQFMDELREIEADIREKAKDLAKKYGMSEQDLLPRICFDVNMDAIR